MTYTVVLPPFSVSFRKMDAAQQTEYVRWFHDVAPRRIDELCRAVRETHDTWTCDRTPQSLDLLGAWFTANVETRKTTPQEVEDFLISRVLPLDAPETELTTRTYSVAFDVGLYFGTVVLAHIPGTRWDQLTKNKRDADYGQPVIIVGAVPLNPIRVAVTAAFGISRNNPPRLREKYEAWVALSKKA